MAKEMTLSNRIDQKRAELKKKLQNRERLFAGWVSFAHPSITETFAYAGFDFIAIDMEHSTITLPEAQRIIAACQADGIPCLPRPVSHSNDYIKPLLESGADGMLIQMVNTSDQVNHLVNDIKYPPVGKRSYGVNRAQYYGFEFDNYINNWNNDSIFIIQVESIEAVNNIDDLLQNKQIDGVMVGPYDISGSLGVPGQTNHPLVIEASKKVIASCEKYGISCGTQVADSTQESVNALFDLGYTFAILGSDLFVLWKWAEKMQGLMNSMRK
jgi:2-dehydro-3-deoxyglucarate aldolase